MRVTFALIVITVLLLDGCLTKPAGEPDSTPTGPSATGGSINSPSATGPLATGPSATSFSAASTLATAEALSQALATAETLSLALAKVLPAAFPEGLPVPILAASPKSAPVAEAGAVAEPDPDACCPEGLLNTLLRGLLGGLLGGGCCGYSLI